MEGVICPHREELILRIATADDVSVAFTLTCKESSRHSCHCGNRIVAEGQRSDHNHASTEIYESFYSHDQCTASWSSSENDGVLDEDMRQCEL